jgi:hypothetical protein
MVNRRRFFRYTLLGAGALAFGYTGYVAAVTFKKSIVDKLAADIEGLKVNKKDMEDYATSIAENHIVYYNDSIIKLFCLYSAYPLRGQKHSVYGIPLPFKQAYNRICRDIVGNFLLSTDFFLNKMDEDREITYSGIVYGPYRSPCGNPFSGMYYKNV